MAIRQQVIPKHMMDRDSIASSRYDAVVGELYQSNYKFMQHLKKSEINKQAAGNFLTAGFAMRDDNLLNGSSQYLDVGDQSNLKLSTSGMVSFHSRFAINETLQNMGSSLNCPKQEAFSSLHSDSNYDPFMHTEKTVQGVWIKPHEFYQDELCKDSDFSLKDISVLMKKNGGVSTKRIMSKFNHKKISDHKY